MIEMMLLIAACNAVVGDVYFKRGECWLDEQQAKEHAETLRQRRVSALMRELERLQAVK